jgi:Na+/melibiose symporter-like transporter
MLLYVPPAVAELWVLLSFAVVGMGMGFAVPAMMIAFQHAIRLGRLGAGMGLMSLFRQFGSSVGTTVVGAIVGASAAVAATSEMVTSIHAAELVQLAAGGLMLVAAWCMADLPLGTGRHAADAEVPAKGQAWNPIAVDH